MHILCIICSDLFNQADNIYATKCGHIFHLHCLSQWIKRSKSCPHCRCEVTKECMFRVFPIVSNENDTEDVAIFKSRLDDALLLLSQETAANKQKDKKLALAIATVTKKNAMIEICTKKLISKQCAVSGLRERLKYFSVECKELQKTREENFILKQNMQSLISLQSLFNCTNLEVDHIVETYTDVRVVATFAAVLRRALSEMETKSKKEHHRLQAVTRQLATEKVESANLRAHLSQLQDKLAATERKYETLRGKQKRPSNIALVECDEHYAKKIRVGSGRDVSNDAVVLSTRDSVTDLSFTNMVNKIKAYNSPYLRARAASPILPATRTLLVPSSAVSSDYRFLNCFPDLTSRTSGWQKYVLKKH